MHRVSIVMFISGLTDPRIITTIAAKVAENGRKFSSVMFPLQETHGAVVIHAARYLLKFSTRPAAGDCAHAGYAASDRGRGRLSLDEPTEENEDEAAS
jgi:hypothetical protein